MEWKIPFFEYDVFTRIVPGALTIAVLRYISSEMPVPAYWKPLLQMTGTSDKLDWGVVFFGGVTLLGASYLIGLIYDSIVGDWLFEWLPEGRLKRAAKERNNWRRVLWAEGKSFLDDPKQTFGKEHLWKLLAQWLASSKDEGVRQAYPHVTRMQAEAKCFAYSVIPLLMACGAGAWRSYFRGESGGYLVAVVFLVLASLFARGVWLREKRRWVQALLILDELRPDDQRPDDQRVDQLRLLQLQLEKYGIDEA